MLDLKALFEKHDDEYSCFERVENKASNRPDLCAFLALDRLAPSDGGDIITAAEHDEIWLDVDLEKLAANATEDDILMLARCGVRFDDMNESLAMFV